MNGVRILGDGVAARCCGHLLTQAGYRVSFEVTERARVPVILLSAAAQDLIRDIFQRGDLFLDAPVIRRRVVAWGSGDPVELEHSAVVVSEEALLGGLRMVSGSADAGWTIYAGPNASAIEHRFGSRMAAAVKVEMKESDSCWMESLEDGWLFLNSGWLIAVGVEAEELLGKSRLVRGQITGWGKAVGRFSASPRMVLPLGGEGWIACGSAAMGFDPLCGDGTAHAVREAILASAVIRAADLGEPVEELVRHYEDRLRAGFQRHLAQCREFYLSGGVGGWWKEQVECCEEGLRWCGAASGFRYRLEGLELKRV